MTCYYKPKYGGGCRHAGLGHWDTELRVYYDEGLAYPQTVTFWIYDEQPCDGENAECPDYIEAEFVTAEKDKPQKIFRCKKRVECGRNCFERSGYHNLQVYHDFIPTKDKCENADMEETTDDTPTAGESKLTIIYGEKK